MPLFGGTCAADTPHMKRSLKVSAAFSLLAYTAGAVAFLWRERAW